MVIYGKDGRPRLSQYRMDLRRWQHRENRFVAFALFLLLVALMVAALPLGTLAKVLQW